MFNKYHNEVCTCQLVSSKTGMKTSNTAKEHNIWTMTESHGKWQNTGSSVAFESPCNQEMFLNSISPSLDIPKSHTDSLQQSTHTAAKCYSSRKLEMSNCQAVITTARHTEHILVACHMSLDFNNVINVTILLLQPVSQFLNSSFTQSISNIYNKQHPNSCIQEYWKHYKSTESSILYQLNESIL